VPYAVTTTRAVSGLRVEAPVRFRGVDVGKVERIGFDPAEPGRVVVGITVDPGTPVTRGTFAQLGFQGVTGLSFIALDDGGANREPLATSAEAPAQIPLRPSLLDSGEGLIGAFGEVAERINQLLAEENRRVLIGAIARIDTASAKAAKLADGLEPAVAGLAPLLADSRAAVNEARAAVGRAAEMVAAMTSLATKLEERSAALARIGDDAADVGTAARALRDETLPRINALAEELRHEARVLDRVLTGLADQPNSLVFGLPPRRAGPGEAGFDGR